MPDSKLVIEFGHIDRETDNKFRYVEEVDETPAGQPGVDAIGKLYLRKTAAAKIGNPKKLRVTIEALP